MRQESHVPNQKYMQKCVRPYTLNSKGFGIVKTLVGHGIGEFFHGVPQARFDSSCHDMKSRT